MRTRQSGLIFEINSLLTSRSSNIKTLDADNLISVCSKKLESDPTHKKALFLRASNYLKNGNLNQAIEDCNSLMKLIT